MERVQPNKMEMSIHPPSSSGKKEMDYPLALDHVCTIISNCSYNKFRILTKICTIDRVICYAIFLGPHCTGHIHVSIDAVLTHGKFKYKYLQNEYNE